jgi:hypothetical protein
MPESASLLNMNTIVVRGTITLNGAPLMVPESSVQPRVFAVESTSEPTQGTPVRSDGSYELRLLRGTRAALAFEWSTPLCHSSTAPPRAVACGRAQLTDETVFASDRSIDASLRAHNVELEVSVNGLLLPRETSALTRISLGHETGPALVEMPSNQRFVSLLAGRWRTRLRTPYVNCDAQFPLVCGDHDVEQPFDARADGVVSIPVRTRRLTGALTYNGSADPLIQQFSHPTIQFFSRSGRANSVHVEPRERYRYSVRVFDEPLVGYIAETRPCVLDDVPQGRQLCGHAFFLGCPP